MAADVRVLIQARPSVVFVSGSSQLSLGTIYTVAPSQHSYCSGGLSVINSKWGLSKPDSASLLPSL